jgi:hypothetical protein
MSLPNRRNGLRRAASIRLGALWLLTAGLLLAPLGVQAQRGTIAESVTSGQTITWFMPLRMAAVILQQRYGKVVTFEDTWRDWVGELAPVASGSTRITLKPHSLTLPPDVQPGGASSAALDLPSVQKVIDAYHQQNPMGARFRVSQSALGFHIIAAQVRGASGTLQSAANPLDAKVTVPSESRTAWEHMKALTDAASTASGVYVEPFSSSFDDYFAANGYTLPMGGITPEDRKYMVFSWGAPGVSAREALVDLLLHSCSTLTWALQCERSLPNAPAGGCVLNILSVPVGDPPKSLLFDRCKDTRPLPAR